ncbi:serine carboxypeptidase-like [Triticum aestivum]|nr:serine carboxypeptidase-like [Aegilops tauschii subsp. strangulata]XP_044334557.1 serine carboxypeptidase-like [Triticum aestivum]
MGPTGQPRALLLLLLAAAAAVAAAPEHESLLRLPSSARSLAPKTPRSAGADLIRALNLHPRDASPRRPGGVGVGGGDALPAGTLVERPIRLASLVAGDDGSGDTSVSNLGHHAGYYRLPTTHDARLFYFFFESRRHKKEDPVVIWLTGGPGCSSELALFYENGPFHIADNMSLLWNDFGWDQESNLIYVDQPTGTGFSYSSDSRDTRHNEASVSNDLYDFLQAFFKEHPEYVENDFYITGESYAGHYIPAFATRVYKGNKNNEGIHINLKGFAIGNGLTDPAIQYKAYTDYALDMGLITQSEFSKINKIVPACEFAVKLCGTSGTVSCLAAYFVCNTIFSSIRLIIGSKNYYDIRKPCVGSLCYDFSNLEKFLNLKSVRQSLGVGDIEFVSCSPTVYQAMLLDWMRNLEVGIPELLENDIKVLIYAGEYDLICNWLGNSRWVDSMEWSGKKAFVSSTEKPFMVDGKEAGVLKSHGPLSFLKVHDSGHMVPMDQPKAALEMLKRWTSGNLSDASGSQRLDFAM